MMAALRLALLLLALLAGCQVSNPRLPSAPFDLRAAPASLVEGDPLTLTLAPHARGTHTVEPLDVYVSFERDSGRAWGYLAPSGAWTATAAPYTRIAGSTAPVTVRFASASPFGQYTFVAQFVRPGGTPSRGHYVFAPLVATVAIRPAARAEDRLAPFVGSLGALTVAVVALVFIFSRTRRPPADSATDAG